MVTSIMVIDNYAHIRVLLGEILTMAGHEVHLYDYALPGRAELLRVRPVLIICDYLLDDDAPGRELWRMIGCEPVLADTRLLLCTTSVARLAARAGWWTRTDIPIIAKPFDVHELLVAVHQALAAPGAPAPDPRISIRPADAARALRAIRSPGAGVHTPIGA
jgi:phosphoserine phosphatase RsbU/P